MSYTDNNLTFFHSFFFVLEETNDKEEAILTTQKSETEPNENDIRNHKDTFIATLSKFEENSLKVGMCVTGCPIIQDHAKMQKFKCF